METSDEQFDVRLAGIVIGNHKFDKRQFARHLRRDMTPAEVLLWRKLRSSQLAGLHFRRQQIIDGFIVDFFCHQAGLVIELDGSIHAGQGEEDSKREDALRLRNLHILRFSNERVVHEIQEVLDQIVDVAEARISCIKTAVPI